jgi:hypothetical protein
MALITANDITEKLEVARAQLRIGAQYFHYKFPDELYTVIDIGVMESSKDVAVIYRAEFGDLQGTLFIRAVNDFLAEIHVNDQVITRFNLVVEN